MICELVKYNGMPAILIGRSQYSNMSIVPYYCTTTNMWVKEKHVLNTDIIIEPHVSTTRNHFY